MAPIFLGGHFGPEKKCLAPPPPLPATPSEPRCAPPRLPSSETLLPSLFPNTKYPPPPFRLGLLLPFPVPETEEKIKDIQNVRQVIFGKEKRKVGKTKSTVKASSWSTVKPPPSRRSDNRTLFCQNPQEVTFEEPVKRHSWRDTLTGPKTHPESRTEIPKKRSVTRTFPKNSCELLPSFL